MNRKYILIVEDEELVAASYEMALSLLGLACCVVASGEQALDRVKERAPHAVVLDVQLGEGIDGIETARRMRELGAWPIVLTTGGDLDEVQEQTQSLGRIAYLIKPTAMRDLVQLIAQADSSPGDDAATRA